MAELVERLVLDASQFLATLKQAEGQSVSFGVRVSGAIEDISKSFKSAQDESKKSADAIKNAMAALIVAGKDGTAEYKKLENEFKSATATANTFSNALKKVEQSTVAPKTALSGLFDSFKKGQADANSGGGLFGSIAGTLGSLISPVGAVTAGIGLLTAGIGASISIGKEFEQNLASVSAVTGLTGAGLQDIGDRAVDLSKKFGGSATTQLQAFQATLSKLGADLAETPNELGSITESINVLAKAGGLNAAESTDVLANSMLQFGATSLDAAGKAKQASQFINVLAASARVGAAEIPQVGQAVLVAGVAAKSAKVSFEETNAAIQVLAAGGKVGAEAGTALRNVLGKLGEGRFLPKDVQTELKKAGVDIKKLADTTIPFADRLEELKKIQKDSALVTKLFGTENASAAKILLEGTATIKQYTKEITGTDDATTQAAKNMNTFDGAIDRLKSNFEAVAIAVFQKISPALTFIANAVANLFSGESDFGGNFIKSFQKIYNALAPIVELIVKGLFLELQIGLEFLKAVWGAVFDAVGAFADRLGSILQPLGAELSKLFGSFGKGAGVMSIITTAFGVLSDILGGVLKIALGVVAKGIELVVAHVRALIFDAQRAYKLISDTTTAVYNWAASFDVVKKAIGFVTDVLKANIKSITDTYDALVQFLGLAEEKPPDTSKYAKDWGNTADEITQSTENITAATEKLNEVPPPKPPPKKDKRTELQLAQEQFKIAEAGAKQEKDKVENDAKAAAIAQGRVLSERELSNIKEQQAAIDERLYATALKIFKASEDNGKISIGIKVKASDKDALASQEAAIADLQKKTTDIRYGLLPKKDAAKQIEDEIKSLIERIKISSEVDLLLTDKNAKENAENLLKQLQEKISELKTKQLAAENVFSAVFGIQVDPEAQTKAKDEIAKLENEFNELQSKLTENVKKAAIERRDAEISIIVSKDERELQASILSLEKQRDAEVETAKKVGLETTNIAKRFNAEIEALKIKSAEDTAARILEINVAGLLASESRSLAEKITSLQKQRDEILNSEEATEEQKAAIRARFSQDISAAVNSEVDEAKKKRAELEKELQKEAFDIGTSLAKRELSYQEYQAKIDELNNKRAEADKAVVDAETNRQKALADIRAAGFQLELDGVNSAANAQAATAAAEQLSLEERIKNAKSFGEIQDILHKDIAERERGYFADIAKDGTVAYTEIGTAAIAGLGIALLAGKNTAKEAKADFAALKQDVGQIFADTGIEKFGAGLEKVTDTNVSFDNIISGFTDVTIGASEMYSGLLTQGQQFDQAFDNVITSVNDKTAAAFDALAQKQLSSFSATVANIKSITDISEKSFADLATGLSATFVSQQVQGKNLADSFDATVKQLNTTVSTSLNDMAAAQTDKFQKTAAAGAAAWDAFAASAALSFSAAVISGQDSSKALLNIIYDLVGQLVLAYTPAILALFTSVIPPPFGTIAGLSAIAVIQGLLAAAKANNKGFKEGRFPAKGEDPNKAVGTAHGGEYIAPAKTTTREYDLFKFLHGGGTSKDYFDKHYLPSVLAKNGIATAKDNAITLPKMQFMQMQNSVQLVTQVNRELVSMRGMEQRLDRTNAQLAVVTTELQEIKGHVSRETFGVQRVVSEVRVEDGWVTKQRNADIRNIISGG